MSRLLFLLALVAILATAFSATILEAVDENISEGEFDLNIDLDEEEDSENIVAATPSISKHHVLPNPTYTKKTDDHYNFFGTGGNRLRADSSNLALPSTQECEREAKKTYTTGHVLTTEADYVTHVSHRCQKLTETFASCIEWFDGAANNPIVCPTKKENAERHAHCKAKLLERGISRCKAVTKTEDAVSVRRYKCSWYFFHDKAVELKDAAVEKCHTANK